MAEKSSQDAIMPLMRLKQVLAFAERERLGCAFGLTKDKQEALLPIDTTAKVREVGEGDHDEFEKSKNLFEIARKMQTELVEEKHSYKRCRNSRQAGSIAINRLATSPR